MGWHCDCIGPRKKNAAQLPAQTAMSSNSARPSQISYPPVPPNSVGPSGQVTPKPGRIQRIADVITGNALGAHASGSFSGFSPKGLPKSTSQQRHEAAAAAKPKPRHERHQSRKGSNGLTQLVPPGPDPTADSFETRTGFSPKPEHEPAPPGPFQTQHQTSLAAKDVALYDAELMSQRDDNRAQRKAFGMLRNGSFSGLAASSSKGPSKEATTKLPTDEHSMDGNVQQQVLEPGPGIGLGSHDLAKLNSKLKELKGQRRSEWSSDSSASSVHPLQHAERPMKQFTFQQGTAREEKPTELLHPLQRSKNGSRDRASASTIYPRSNDPLSSPKFRRDMLVYKPRERGGYFDSDTMSDDSGDVDSGHVSSTSSTEEFVGSPCYPSPVLRVRRTSPPPFASYHLNAYHNFEFSSSSTFWMNGLESKHEGGFEIGGEVVQAMPRQRKQQGAALRHTQSYAFGLDRVTSPRPQMRRVNTYIHYSPDMQREFSLGLGEQDPYSIPDVPA